MSLTQREMRFASSSTTTRLTSIATRRVTSFGQALTWFLSRCPVYSLHNLQNLCHLIPRYISTRFTVYAYKFCSMSPLVFLVSILFSCYVTPIFADIRGAIHCAQLTYLTRIKPTIADCQAAINMRPDGRIEFTGEIPGPGEALAFRLPDSARPVYTFPAVFRSGSCAVSVIGPMVFSVHGIFQLHPPRLQNVAHAAYFTMWPDVKKAAGNLFKECVLAEQAEGRGGHAEVGSVVEGNQYVNAVYVEAITPKPLRPPPAKYELGETRVYQHDEHGRIVLTAI